MIKISDVSKEQAQKERIKKANEELSAILAQKASLDSRVREINFQIAGIEKEHERLSQKLGESLKIIQTAKSRKAELDSREVKVSSKENYLKQFEAKLNDLDGTLKKREVLVQNREMSNRAKDKQLADIEAEIAKGNRSFERVKKVLSATEQELGNIHTAIVRKQSVEPGSGILDRIKTMIARNRPITIRESDSVQK